MKIDSNDLLSSILESISRIDYVHPEDIPNIDLYMDQVTTFMDEQLTSTKRYESDKILTKTMINNYVKNNLLPAPTKKKYSKEHVLVLIFIYYFKNILSIKDIESLLTPITEKCFCENPTLDITALYEEICRSEKEQISPLIEHLKACFEKSEQMFLEEPEENRDSLQLFSFICSLSFDVYVKKLLIEKIIDGFSNQE